MFNFSESASNTISWDLLLEKSSDLKLNRITCTPAKNPAFKHHQKNKIIKKNENEWHGVRPYKRVLKEKFETRGTIEHNAYGSLRSMSTERIEMEKKWNCFNLK